MTSAIAFAIQNGFVEIAEFLFQKGGRFGSKGDLKESKERGERFKQSVAWFSQYSDEELSRR